MPSFGGEVKESVPCPSFAACKRTYYLRELRCASKIPCIVPSLASRGLSCLCDTWRLWRWMRGTHWGARVQSAYRLQCRKAPHATFKNSATFYVPKHNILKIRAVIFLFHKNLISTHYSFLFVKHGGEKLKISTIHQRNGARSGLRLREFTAVYNVKLLWRKIRSSSPELVI